jgi:hypothetical protein
VLACHGDFLENIITFEWLKTCPKNRLKNPEKPTGMWFFKSHIRQEIWMFSFKAI